MHKRSETRLLGRTPIMQTHSTEEEWSKRCPPNMRWLPSSKMRRAKHCCLLMQAMYLTNSLIWSSEPTSSSLCYQTSLPSILPLPPKHLVTKLQPDNTSQGPKMVKWSLPKRKPLKGTMQPGLSMVSVQPHHWRAGQLCEAIQAWYADDSVALVVVSISFSIGGSLSVSWVQSMAVIPIQRKQWSQVWILS